MTTEDQNQPTSLGSSTGGALPRTRQALSEEAWTKILKFVADSAAGRPVLLDFDRVPRTPWPTRVNCNYGGYYLHWALPNGAKMLPGGDYLEKCREPAEIRFRYDAPGTPWQHRCPEHAKYLTAPDLIIERFDERK